jgi:hypothetical protein
MKTALLLVALLSPPGPVATPPFPVLRSGSETLDILDGDELQSGAWRISPEIDPDVYEARLVDGRAHRVTFSSDLGSIHFDVEEGKQYDFVVLYGGRACRTRIVGTRFTPPAVFDEAYRKAHRGTTLVEIPEVYELVNVAIAMTPTGIADRNLVYQDSDYYGRMRAWFDRFREHPLLRSLEAELAHDGGRYFALKMNGYSFLFDEGGRIVQSPVYDRTGSVGERSNSLRPHLEQLQQFADASDFRRFYRENRALYEEQIAFFREQADLAGMLRWLGRNFPGGGYDGYKIVFSPLVAYNQSATWFVTPGYRELMAHVNFPYERDLARSQAETLSPAAALLFRGNIVFTELNHGYINPQADRHAARARAAVADHDFWVDAAKGTSYYRGLEAFNEYMNWGLVSLRFLDLAPAEERAGMIDRVDRMMVGRRGFLRFREFDAFLTALYLGRRPDETIADLYPRILEWFEREYAAANLTPPR